MTHRLTRDECGDYSCGSPKTVDLVYDLNKLLVGESRWPTMLDLARQLKICRCPN
jgi:hypothetical protein